MVNTWPGERRHAMEQDSHERWNAQHYPGTRQICSLCEAETDRCEEDSLEVADSGPLCETCYLAEKEHGNG
jgi:hypothetical protein